MVGYLPLRIYYHQQCLPQVYKVHNNGPTATVNQQLARLINLAKRGDERNAVKRSRNSDFIAIEVSAAKQTFS